MKGDYIPAFGPLFVKTLRLSTYYRLSGLTDISRPRGSQSWGAKRPAFFLAGAADLCFFAGGDLKALQSCNLPRHYGCSGQKDRHMTNAYHRKMALSRSQIVQESPLVFDEHECHPART
jgi:hypothetical protein